MPNRQGVETKSTATVQEPKSVFQQIARVCEVQGAKLFVETTGGRYEARRALSCLIAPLVEDQVLLAVPPSGDLFVLAVLERPEEQTLTLLLEGDAAIKAQGKLSLEAATDLRLQAIGEVSSLSRHLDLTSLTGQVCVDKLGLFTRAIETHAEKVKGVIGTLDTFMERASHHLKRSYRFVEELDMTRAGEVELRTEGTYSLRTENTLMRSDNLVKVQAEQVHLG